MEKTALGFIVVSQQVVEIAWYTVVFGSHQFAHRSTHVTTLLTKAAVDLDPRHETVDAALARRWRVGRRGAEVLRAALVLCADHGLVPVNQFLPVYVNLSKHNPVLQTLSGPAVLLVWLYVMANVMVLGAEVNWWRGQRARASDNA